MSHEGEIQPEKEMNSGEAEDSYLIKVCKVLEKKIGKQPELLRTSAGWSICCIFRVPRSYIDINGPNAYFPEIVSIGPYHHRKSHDSRLQMLEEHKSRYLGSLVSRTKRLKGAGLATYLKAIQLLESKVRYCYSESIDLNVNIEEFMEMMVLDGCFIIELFRKVGGVVGIERDDPIFSMGCLLSPLVRDLLKLENQVPWFVLQSLFDVTDTSGEKTKGSLARLALKFFGGTIAMLYKFVESNNDELVIPIPEIVLRSEKKDASSEDKWPRHLLDFIRSSFIPDHQEPPKKRDSGCLKHLLDFLPQSCIPDYQKPGKVDPQIRSIACATKLRRTGIECKSNTGDSPLKNSFLDIKFSKNGVIEIPAITIDDVTSTFLLNCVAYEQCHRTPDEHAYFTAYAIFMDNLINTPEDVGLLCDDQVIGNSLGGDEEVAQFFNKSTIDVSVDFGKCHLSKVFDDINEYYRTSSNVWWATFHHKYFDSPWSIISLVAAVILLFLTISQTFFAAYEYYQSRKG